MTPGVAEIFCAYARLYVRTRLRVFLRGGMQELVASRESDEMRDDAMIHDID